MKLDYNVLSQDYDLTRSVNPDTVRRILSRTRLGPDCVVVDFGCGTGNYTCAVQRLTGANVFGVEPSAGMREKAAEKCSGVVFLQGDHSAIPLGSGCADLLYMTDVIHHIPDLDLLFGEIWRVLKPGGFCCILTESHRQIADRYWSGYFPATVAVEQVRYPDIDAIVTAAQRHGFLPRGVEVTDRARMQALTGDFVERVARKGYSMLRLITDGEFEVGLAALRRDFEAGVQVQTSHGESFVWLQKGERTGKGRG